MLNDIFIITMFDICKIVPIWIPPSHSDAIEHLCTCANTLAETATKLGISSREAAGIFENLHKLNHRSSAKYEKR